MQIIHKGMLRRLCPSRKKTEARRRGGTYTRCGRMAEEAVGLTRVLGDVLHCKDLMNAVN